MVISTSFSLAAEWDERMCETGDYIPLFLYGVWGSSPVDVFFVGDKGYILHYDGSQCSVMGENPFTGKIANLYDIWGSSNTDVFAVGGNAGEILHYDGIKWTLIRKSMVDQQLYGIWGYSPIDVFAVGSGGVILHYDGETWSEMDSGTTFTLYDIWGTAPNDIFAVGYAGTILRYNGEIWNALSFQTYRNLYGVWGSSNHDVYAVGDGPYVNQPSGSVFYYDGKTSFWNERFRYTGRYLRGVWGSSANDIYFVGGMGPLVGANSGIILHYDGVNTPVVYGESPGMVHDIWGSAGNDVYAVGFGYRILHYDGSETVTTTIPTSSTTALSTTTTSIPLTTSTSIVAATTSTSIVTGTSTTSVVQRTTSILPTTTTSTVKLCPIIFLAEGEPEKLSALREFRDRVLMNTVEGRKHIIQFYKHSPEITSIMLINPSMAVKSKDVLNTFMPVIRSALTREKISLTVVQTQEIILVLDSIDREASPLLQQDLRQLKQSIQSGVIFNTFKGQIEK